MNSSHAAVETSSICWATSVCRCCHWQRHPSIRRMIRVERLKRRRARLLRAIHERTLMLLRWTSVCLMLTLAAACERERRPIPPDVIRVAWRDVTEPERQKLQDPYEINAYSMSEGKRLYSSFNCVGCHAHGGGGMGPPLMDDKWIYGFTPQDVFTTIAQGRPNGMPAFKDHLVEGQIWQLVSYVRSMSGQVSKISAPNRDDHLKGPPPENTIEMED